MNLLWMSAYEKMENGKIYPNYVLKLPVIFVASSLVVTYR